MKHTPGHCPKCNSENIIYGNMEVYDESIGYHLYCNDCDFEGEEIANLTFSHFQDIDGNEIEE